MEHLEVAFDLGPMQIARCEFFDSQAGFIVSLLDGLTTVEELLDISAMSAETTLAILDSLCKRRLVELQ